MSTTMKNEIIMFYHPPSPIYRPVFRLPFQNIKKTRTLFFFFLIEHLLSYVI